MINGTGPRSGRTAGATERSRGEKTPTGANMTTSKSPAVLAAVAVVLGVCANAQTRSEDASSSASARNFLSLDFENNGQSVAATVGKQIELTLGMVGPQQYGDPQISSPAIRLEGTALAYPVNPGGPTFIYMFEAVTEGEVQIKVPVINALNPDMERTRRFSVTIRVGPRTGNPATVHATLRTDQANPEPWKNGWINAINVLRQSFVPSLPRLTGVEVELVPTHLGPATGEITMVLSNTEGEGLASVWKNVSADDCSHVLFLLPRGGVKVSPGQVYSIELSGGGGVFGWKYVMGGYAKGAASWKGIPLSSGARSTFLFRTFGTD